MEFTEVVLTEWIGYLAMATVLLSFLMKDVNKLRFVNSLGCLFFVIYGFMLEPLSYPIIITNLAIFGINGYYLLTRKA